MIAIGIITAIIFLLAITKIGILVIWDEALSLRLIVGPIRINISSGKKEKSEKKPPKERSAESGGEKVRQKEKKKSPWPRVLLLNWQELLELVGRVLHMPLLDPLVLKVTFAGEDPADSAVNYGRAWGVVGALMPFLERNFTIGRRDIDVDYDRSADKISVYAKAALTVRIGQCVSLAVSALVLFLKLYKETKQSEKAVQIK